MQTTVIQFFIAIKMQMFLGKAAQRFDFSLAKSQNFELIISIFRENLKVKFFISLNLTLLDKLLEI